MAADGEAPDDELMRYRRWFEQRDPRLHARLPVQWVVPLGDSGAAAVTERYRQRVWLHRAQWELISVMALMIGPGSGRGGSITLDVRNDPSPGAVAPSAASCRACHTAATPSAPRDACCGEDGACDGSCRVGEWYPLSARWRCDCWDRSASDDRCTACGCWRPPLIEAPAARGRPSTTASGRPLPDSRLTADEVERWRSQLRERVAAAQQERAEREAREDGAGRG